MKKWRRPILLGILGIVVVLFTAMGDLAGCINGTALQNAPIFEDIGKINGGGSGGSSNSGPENLSPF